MSSSRVDMRARPSQQSREQSYPPTPPPKDQPEQSVDDEPEADDESFPALPPLPPLPTIPSPELDLSLELDIDAILGPSPTPFDKMQKRASNVMKLSEENDKLKAELRAMTERIEAAERRRADLEKRAREASGDVERSSSSS